MAKASLELVTPGVPNFIRIKGTMGVVSVGDLSDEELTALADSWRAALLENAWHRRGTAK